MSNAGDSERIRGSLLKLYRGGGLVVAHSSERPQPHGSSLLTSGALRLIQTFQRNGSIETPSRNAPTEEIWFRKVKPSVGR